MHFAKIKPTYLAAGALGVVGLFVLTQKAKAAKASSSSSSSSSPTLGNAAPPAKPSAPQPRALPSRTPPEEGQPLAWDKSVHPLAERGLSDSDAAKITVQEIPVEPAEPVTTTAPRDADFPPEVKTIIDVTPPAQPSKPKPTRPTPTPKIAAKPPAPPSPPPPEVLPAATRSAEDAARELYDRAKALLAAGKGAQLGTKNAPSSFVRDAQQDMGGITTDGIYGPGTRARGKALIGKTFPVRK